MGEYSNTKLYNGLFNNMKPDYPMLYGAITVSQPRTICELACGDGRLLPLFLSFQDINIIGLDIEPEMIESFKSRGGDRVKSMVSDLCMPLPDISDAELLILSGSTLRLIHPQERLKVLNNIYKAMNDNAALYIDHCEVTYGFYETSPWRTYYDTLRFWWTAEYWEILKKFSWKKEVTETMDIYSYRYNPTGESAVINTYIYSFNDLLSDLEKAGFKVSRAFSEYQHPYNVNNHKRFIGFATGQANSQNSSDLLSERLKNFMK